MSDPKYRCIDGDLYHIDGYVIPEDEPLMVLRGKDIGAIEAIVAYIEMLDDQPQNAVINSHLISSMERLKAFYEYQLNNPELQSVGCSRRAHSGSHSILLRAKSTIEDHRHIFEE